MPPIRDQSDSVLQKFAGTYFSCSKATKQSQDTSSTQEISKRILSLFFKPLAGAVQIPYLQDPGISPVRGAEPRGHHHQLEASVQSLLCKQPHVQITEICANKLVTQQTN